MHLLASRSQTRHLRSAVLWVDVAALVGRGLVAAVTLLVLCLEGSLGVKRCSAWSKTPQVAPMSDSNASQRQGSGLARKVELCSISCNGDHHQGLEYATANSECPLMTFSCRSAVLSLRYRQHQ